MGRNSGLSMNTIQGLHQIVQAVQSQDYNTSLALHTQLVSTTNFTEIGSFMPGLKVLLQFRLNLESCVSNDINRGKEKKVILKYMLFTSVPSIFNEPAFFPFLTCVHW